MKKITYIIPLHEFNEKIKKYYISAIESLNNITNNEGNKAILIGPSNVIEEALSTCSPNIETDTIYNDDIDFFTQINKAVYKCVTAYFSILEIDDEFRPFWKDAMEEYEKIGASIMIPINEFFKNGAFVSLGNEIAWSSSFANISENGEGIGYLDIDCLKSYMDFNVTGSLFKTEDFIYIGGLKPSLKFASWYEFLLRMAYNGKKIFVVPKAAYVHTIDREGSYMNELLKTLPDEEGKILIEKARQEYFFKNDRTASDTNVNN